MQGSVPLSLVGRPVKFSQLRGGWNASSGVIRQIGPKGPVSSALGAGNGDLAAAVVADAVGTGDGEALVDVRSGVALGPAGVLHPTRPTMTIARTCDLNAGPSARR
jgi:hypothetical protein